jgi:hypothetical protein
LTTHGSVAQLTERRGSIIPITPPGSILSF